MSDIVGSSWTPPEESEVPDRKVEARRKRLQSELVLPVDNLERWQDTATALACRVRDDFRAGRVPEAKTLTAALNQACERYAQQNGKRFTTKSLLELLRKERAKTEGDPI